VELTSNIEVQALLPIMEEPSFLQDAGDGQWVSAMESEIHSIHRNKTWELV
jgi:hypothetical protein